MVKPPVIVKEQLEIPLIITEPVLPKENIPQIPIPKVEPAAPKKGSDDVRIISSSAF